MSDSGDTPLDPGAADEPRLGRTTYVVGLVLAAALTGLAFYLVSAEIIWAPALPATLIVLAIAQIGVHLVFFLHLTSGPDKTNHLLALAFGLLVILLVVLGSLWIMANMASNMPPME